MNNPTTNDSVISNFYFWCQKVLPLVYDGTLSYYEVLCRMSEKLNEVIASNNNLNEAFATLKNWIDTELKDYATEILMELLQQGQLLIELNYDENTKTLNMVFGKVE